jgi:hypothetical protein
MFARSRTLMVIGFIGLIVLGFLLIAVPPVTSPARLTPPTGAPTIPAQRLNEGPAPEVPRINVSDAYAAYTTKQAIFVDVRSTSQYEARHVAGAVSIPLVDLESRVNTLDKNQRIITYCT